jgi:hypothetical protein
MDKKEKAVNLLYEYERKNDCMEEDSWKKLVVEILKLFD